MYKYINHLLPVSLVILLIAACSEKNEANKYFDAIDINNLANSSIIYPLEAAVFPNEIPPPSILWKDDTANINTWAVLSICGDQKKLLADNLKEQQYKPDYEYWESLKQLPDRKISLVVLGFSKDDPDKIISQNAVNISISADKVGAPVFYRAVTLPFEYAVNHLETISWRLGDIGSEKAPHAVLENLPLCGNCHSFTPDGKTLAMDIDYANDKGSYYINDVKDQMNITEEQIITWSEYKREDGEQTFGLLSQISPDGRYVLSTVKDRSIFVPVDNLEYSQLFFPIKGIIAVYDRHEKKYYSLPGADNPAFVQSNPVWSPDGQYILFSKAPYFKCPEAEKSKKAVLPKSVAADFVEGRQGFQYDIYKIPFNGGKGGEAVPLEGASGNGMSNFFPRFSPDGKWIVFSQAKNFMLLQPDSKLYIMPAEGGKPREMNCNTQNMNSWHSWSPNGKWLVYSSKFFGPYTQLFITKIDENGNDSPPVWLENLNIKNRAANIPEFVNIEPGRTFNLHEKFLKNENYSFLNAMEKVKAGQFAEAVKDFDDAAEQEPDNYMVYSNRGLAKVKMGQFDAGLTDINKAIELKPDDYSLYHSRGYVLVELGDYPAAIKDLSKAIEADNKMVSAYYERGMAYFYSNDFNNAVEDFNKVIEIDPATPPAYYQRGLCLAESGKKEQACADFEKALSMGMEIAREAIEEYCR